MSHSTGFSKSIPQEEELKIPHMPDETEPLSAGDEDADSEEIDTEQYVEVRNESAESENVALE